METREFFEAIFQDGYGEAVIVLPNRDSKPVYDHWFSYPAQLDEMVKLVGENEGHDVWFSPNLFTERTRKKEYSAGLAIAGADADTCDPHNFRLEPSVTVQTSPGRWQVYFRLEDWDDWHPEAIAKINRRISQVHKDDGCDVSFINTAKLMRVPGTSNNKHPGAIVSVVDYEDTLTYSVGQLQTAYPEDEVPDAVEAAIGDMPENLMEYIRDNRSRLLNDLPNNDSLRQMIFGDFHGERRSEVLFRLMCELYRIGLDDREVMAVAWGVPANKFNGEDPRGLKGLWDTALLRSKTAAFDPEYQWDITPGVGNGFIDEEEPAKRKTVGVIGSNKFDFLTEEEREAIKDHTNFIQEWVQWASTKTDAPAEFHRAACMTVLSAVYSEFGHATPKWGKMKLNLWFMVLGRSTNDRKSTARSYMNSAFRELKDDNYSYILGEDVTPGGISLALHDRANKSSVFDRDEVQGLFKELLHQSYMSGGTEVFTKLYDGWSGGRLRASGDRKVQESVPVSFLMFVMGILSETADVLTVTNFRSGFLTRFLYVFGSRPDGYVPPPMEQSEEKHDKSDPVFDGLVKHLRERRTYWEMYGGGGDTFAMRATDDAWARLQEFEAQVKQAVNESAYSEYVGTTGERMIHSTLKLAALLAMDDKAKRIEYHHMLQAIGYAGEWFGNAITMASMVSESEWQRDVDKLEHFINSKGGQVSYAVAYRNFADKRPFEFEEMVSALAQRGVLTRENSGSRWVLKVSYGD